MAINRTFSGAVFSPNVSSYLTTGPEWVRHEISVNAFDGDWEFTLACLRALRNVRIISGVRSRHAGEIWIDARIPSDE